MNDADLIWKMVLAVSVLAGIAVAVKRVFFSRMPQPFEVRETDSFMSRREAAHQFSIFEARILAVERRLDKDLCAVRADLTDMQSKIDGVAKQNAEHHAEVMRAIGRLEGSLTR